MAVDDDMPAHPRLVLRGKTYYHRAAIPKDIADSYPKREETFSLRTRDHREAVVRVRRAAAEVDARFEAHRASLAPPLRATVRELTPEHIGALKDAYFRHLLEEDEELRLDGFEDLDASRRFVGPMQFDPRPTFEEHEELTEDMAAVTRHNLARGNREAPGDAGHRRGMVRAGHVYGGHQEARSCRTERGLAVGPREPLEGPAAPWHRSARGDCGGGRASDQ